MDLLAFLEWDDELFRAARIDPMAALRYE